MTVSVFLTVLAVLILPRLAWAWLRPYLPDRGAGVLWSLAAVPVLLMAALLLDVCR